VQVIAREPAGVLLDHRGPLDETHAVVRVGGSVKDVVERVIRSDGSTAISLRGGGR